MSLLVALSVAFSQRAMGADTSTTATAQTTSKAGLEAWRQAISAAPPTKKGCYTLKYPSKVWKEVSCGALPANPPRTLSYNQPSGTGNGFVPNVQPLLAGDYMIKPTNTISSATGTIMALTNVTSVGSINSFDNSYNANLFSVQLNSNSYKNTNLLSSGSSLAATTGNPSCSSSPNKSTSATRKCQGWIQFVYNSDGQLYIQYWLLNYLSSTSQKCPKTLLPLNDSPGFDCAYDPQFGTVAAPTDFTKLQGATLTGQLSSNGTANIILTVGDVSYSNSAGAASVPPPGSTWTQAEFNVFGRGTLSPEKMYTKVLLNAGAEITIGLTSDNDNSGKLPQCQKGSTTGEKSNLYLGPCNTTTVPGIWFNESPTTPDITSLSPSQGPAGGGISVQVLGGPFNQRVQIMFGNQIVSPTNTLPDDVTVLSPPGTVGTPDSVIAAYIFPNGAAGPFSAPAPQQFSYFNTPSCTFSTYCPFYQGQPPLYTVVCPTPSDFYLTDNGGSADFVPIALGVLTNTGSTTSEAVGLAVCEPGSKTECKFFGISVPVTNWCGGGVSPPPRPPTCTQCGSEKKCCRDPFGGKGHVCVALNVPCPPLQ